MTYAADVQRDRRRAFATPGGFHDKLIRTLAVVLPGAIGAIAAVMILTPLAPRNEISFLLDRNKVTVAPDRIRLDSAIYRGRDKLGRPFAVTAGSAVQTSAMDPVVRLGNLAASIILADGPAKISAPDGIYDFDNDTVKVSGPVAVDGPAGYRMSASGVTIDLKQRRISGTGGISGAIPAGTFSANAIFADLAERRITLDGNARLRMAPGKLRMP